MKKVILFVFYILTASAALGQTLQRTLLSHNGNLTQYDANHWQKAFTNAVAGDTIYFTPGLFSGALTIDKPLTLIGAGVGQEDCNSSIKAVYGNYYTTGSSTKLDTHITIAIPDSVTLTSCMFEGFHLSGITVSNALAGLSLRRCHISNYIGAEASVVNLTLESCYINNISGNNRWFINPDIHNCRINNFTGLLEGTSFTNCVFNTPSYSQPWQGKENLTFVNCIFQNSTPGYCTFVNCLYYTTGSNSTYTNCWKVNNGHNLSAEEITTAGYIGTDGTIVGTFGGPAPFTMKPSQPYIEVGSAEYDATNKVLNVSVKVKRGE